MIVEAIPQITAILADLERERSAAKAEIREEIRDRHDAMMILLESQVTAPNRPTYELFRRSAKRLEKYTDVLFTVLEAM